MPSTKEQKKKIIEDLKEKLERQKSIVFVDFSGLKVKGLANLRKEMKEKDCELKVAKKTLIHLVFEEKGIKIPKEKLLGEIALGYGYKDEILPFKILYNFSKENENLKIIGGLISREFFGKEKAIELAQLLSREGILVKLAGIIKAPISGFVNVLQGNIKGLITVLAKAKT